MWTEILALVARLFGGAAVPRESLTRGGRTAVLQNNVAVGKKARRSESQVWMFS